MDTFFEIIMLLAFITAMLGLIYYFAQNKATSSFVGRCISVTMTIGFIIGAASKAVITPVKWTFVLYISGAIVSYTAILFSFPNTNRDVVNHD